MIRDTGEAMRIAIDGLPLTETLTGVGHYTNELATHLASDFPKDDITVLAPSAFVNSVSEQNNLHHIRVRLRPWNLPWFRPWWSSTLPRYLDKHPFDIFHGTNFDIPLEGNCATVLTVHDLSTLLHANTHEDAPVRRARARLPIVGHAATMIVTPTEFVRAETHQHLGIPLEKIVAIPEAARDCFAPLPASETSVVRRRLGVGDDFLLYVGTIEPRKNLAVLVKSYEQVRRLRDRKLQLVMTGRKGWLVDDFVREVQRSEFAPDIIMPGYLSDADLRALYSSCTAFVYPSIYEGFGLPPLEAMACGAPVIASRIPSIMEVGGPAIRSFAPEDSDELTRVLLEVLDSTKLRNEHSQLGLKRAAEFSWSKAAQATREVYVEAIARFRSA